MIRIATFNIHGGRGHRLASLTSFLTSLDVDVWCLQECPAASVPWFARALGEEWSGEHAPAAFLGNAILTRRPVVSTTRFGLDASAAEERSAMGTVVSIDEREVSVICTHLDHLSEESRLEQWDDLVGQIHNIEEFVVCGDLNALRREDYSDAAWEEIAQVRRQSLWEPPQHTLLDRIEAAGFIDTGEAGVIRGTCRFDTRVDYIFQGAKCRLTVANYEIIDGRHVSDHDVVIADFET